jgi:hypothetical protein
MTMDESRMKRKDIRPNRISDRRLRRRFAWGLCSLIAFVLILQALLRFDSVRSYLNQAIRLEGVRLAREVDGLSGPAYPWLDLTRPDADTGAIYLRLLRRPKGEVWVLVNSRAVKLLDKEGGAVTVQHDDFVEVLSNGGEVRVLVSGASPNVEFPCEGIWVAGTGNVFLARVRLR